MPMKVDLKKYTADHFYFFDLHFLATGERAEWVSNTICRVGFRKRDLAQFEKWINSFEK